MSGAAWRRLKWIPDLRHRQSDGAIRLMPITIARWIAIIGQLFTVLFVQFSLGVELPLFALLPAIAAAAILNLSLTMANPAGGRLGEGGATLLFSFDILQLGYLLAVTGGLNNPFSALIVIPVALAATVLDRVPTIALTGLAVVITALLAFVPWPLPWFDGGLNLPLPFIVAEWAGISIAVLLLASYGWHMAEQARMRAAALQAVQLALAREQQLSALGGQAAAAAHLLGSPLGTINIIAKELIHEFPDDDPVYPELEVLLQETKRCREILAEFGRKPDDKAHSRDFERAPITAHIEALAEQFPKLQKDLTIHKHIAGGAAEPEVALTPGLRHAINNLIDNALQFANRQVTVTWISDAQHDRLKIEDDGPGFSPEVLDWLGEPFHTSRKETGGLGLGIFIAITLLERSNGHLHFSNRPQGARVEIVWRAGDLEVATWENNE